MIATQGQTDVSYARVHPDELSRLWVVDAAAREYAELGQALDDWTSDQTGMDEMLDRHSEAYWALRALFAPSSPVVLAERDRPSSHRIDTNDS